MRQLSILLGTVLLGCFVAGASAQDYRNPVVQTDFSLGYTRLRIDGANSKDLDKNDGEGVHVDGTFAIPGARGFRIGFGLDGSDHFEDYHAIDTNGDNIHRYNDLTMIVPQLELAYYLPIHHFFIEPKLGLGLAVANLSSGHIHHHHYYNDDDDNGSDLYDDQDRWRANAAIIPGIQAGLAYRNFAVGMEADYLYTHLHFGEGLGGDISEIYAGFFLRVQF